MADLVQLNDGLVSNAAIYSVDWLVFTFFSNLHQLCCEFGLSLVGTLITPAITRTSCSTVKKKSSYFVK